MEPGITWYDVLGAVPDAETRTIKRKYQDKAALLRPELISGTPPDVLTAVTRAQHLLDTARGAMFDACRVNGTDEDLRVAPVPATMRRVSSPARFINPSV